MTPQMCLVCEEDITNPICPDCIEKEICAWLSERDPELIPSVKSKGNDALTRWVTNCIICGKNMGICGHCFSKEVLEVINNRNDKHLTNDFISFFNFELV